MSYSVFISYAHEDIELRKQLENHLKLLQHQKIIAPWSDHDIMPGTEWEPQIMERLNNAQIILLLVSSDFMASDFCYGIEMSRALARHNAKQACVIPIILRPVDWHTAPFAGIQALPDGGKPVVTWKHIDEAFANVASGIRKAIKDLEKVSGA